MDLQGKMQFESAGAIVSADGTFRTWLAGLTMSVAGGKADLAITNADVRK
jgi:hypothetical protein